jgi:integrase/recombinase XerD
VKQLIDTFLSEILAEGKSEKTVATYRSGLYRFAREIGKPLPSLSARDIQIWLMGLKGISPFWRHDIRCALSGFFNWCRRWDYLPAEFDIMFKVGRIKRPEIIKPWLTQAQVRKVAETGCAKALHGFLRWKTRALIKFIAWTSLRIDEALTLRWRDVYYDKGYIIVHLKGNRQVTYPIDNDIVSVLREYRVHFDRWQKTARRKKCRSVSECAKHDYIFPAKTGRKWYHAYEAMKKTGNAVGINIHPHKLRHSVAQWYIEGGGGIEGLQVIMGHKRINTTQQYFHQHLKLKKRARKAINFNL